MKRVWEEESAGSNRFQCGICNRGFVELQVDSDNIDGITDAMAVVKERKTDVANQGQHGQ